MLFPVIICFVIIQRLVELVYAKRNAKIMFMKGALEYDKNGYKVIVAMHSLFFISLFFEFYFLNNTYIPFQIIFVIVFGAGQLLRYLAIFTLREKWNTRIIILTGEEPVKKGIYKFLKHPNYLGVVLEILSLPLIFSCYITSIIFTLLNLFILKRRIGIEENLIYHK
jgi:methyltransferase